MTTNMDPIYDELISEVIEHFRTTQRASTSSIQRRFRLGYTRASMIIDELEKRGIVGPYNGDEPRKVLIQSLEVW